MNALPGRMQIKSDRNQTSRPNNVPRNDLFRWFETKGWNHVMEGTALTQSPFRQAETWLNILLLVEYIQNQDGFKSDIMPKWCSKTNSAQQYTKCSSCIINGNFNAFYYHHKCILRVYDVQNGAAQLKRQMVHVFLDSIRWALWGNIIASWGSLVHQI